MSSSSKWPPVAVAVSSRMTEMALPAPMSQPFQTHAQPVEHGDIAKGAFATTAPDASKKVALPEPTQGDANQAPKRCTGRSKIRSTTTSAWKSCAPLIGGITVSFVMELLVYPVIFYLAKRWRLRHEWRKAAHSEASPTPTLSPALGGEGQGEGLSA